MHIFDLRTHVYIRPNFRSAQFSRLAINLRIIKLIKYHLPYSYVQIVQLKKKSAKFSHETSVQKNLVHMKHRDCLPVDGY